MKSVKKIYGGNTIVAGSVISSTVLLSLIFSSVFFNNESAIDQEAFAAISPYIASGTTRVMTFISFLGKQSFLIPANLLLILGRSDFIPVDSWALKLVSHEWYKGEPITAREVEMRFEKWGEFKGFAYWFWDWKCKG